jgi:mono/diheme cytochrome c family protein
MIAAASRMAARQTPSSRESSPAIDEREAMRLFRKVHIAAAAICSGALFAATAGAGSAETLVERGAYLVTTIGACGNCHTPRDAAGHVIPGMALAGGLEFDDAPIGHVVGPNITPEPETSIGRWTEAQIVTALRDGKRPDGTIIGPPMPIPSYRQLSDRDAAAIAAYLRILKPVRHAVARTSYKGPLPPSYGPTVTQLDEPARSDKIAYGAYLAGPVGHCVLCHTPPAVAGRSI